jgi:hypothetical protein
LLLALSISLILRLDLLSFKLSIIAQCYVWATEKRQQIFYYRSVSEVETFVIDEIGLRCDCSISLGIAKKINRETECVGPIDACRWTALNSLSLAVGRRHLTSGHIPTFLNDALTALETVGNPRLLP